MKSQVIKEGWVYRLPNQKQVVASAGEFGWILYTLAEWKAAASADYETEGMLILCQGSETGWLISDLKRLNKRVVNGKIIFCGL
jgi:hypothetical protein